MAGEKTEKATPKKRKDQRKEGNVFQSKDVVTVISLLGSFCCLQLLFPMIYRTLRDCLVQFIGYAGVMEEFGQGDVPKLGVQAGMVVVKGALPILLIGCALSIISTGVQTRFLFTSKAFKPKFSNLNPLNGIKNMFSLKSLVELLKGIVKIILLGVIPPVPPRPCRPILEEDPLFPRYKIRGVLAAVERRPLRSGPGGFRSLLPRPVAGTLALLGKDQEESRQEKQLFTVEV